MISLKPSKPRTKDCLADFVTVIDSAIKFPPCALFLETQQRTVFPVSINI